MESTDGISGGVEVTATGAPIKMPIGDAIKGRVFNVVGDAIDGMENLDNENGLPIHREAQSLRIYQLALVYLLVSR